MSLQNQQAKFWVGAKFCPKERTKNQSFDLRSGLMVSGVEPSKMSGSGNFDVKIISLW